ncbi:MAG: oxepin-CoA hydrolase, alternative type [Hyphomicrobiales bacterium]
MTEHKDDLQIAREGRVLILTLNDPKTRNSLSHAMSETGRRVMTEAHEDDGIGAVVLNGAEGHFCSGGNIDRLRASLAASMTEREESVNKMHGWIKSIRRCGKPVIAAVEGAAAGAGCSIALACDLIVAAADARFVVAYVKIGLNPDGGATAFLNRGLPPQLVSELCFLGDPIGPERLYNLGVVNKVVDPGSALDAAKELAERLANGPGAALARAKQLIDADRRNSFETQLDLEARMINEARSHPEAAEGLNAFLEKRKPDFGKTRK